ncbi:AAA family ATPase [Microvirga sp. GCM10011540]|uniref:ATP-binding protein n=1 Tax=Microvirga sp. GCM10011540 TaxID=3317338 RepID=UPI003615F323
MTKPQFEDIGDDFPCDPRQEARDRAAEERRARRIVALEKLHKSYLRTPRDAQLEDEFERLIDGASLSLNGRRPEGRALVVIGQSGAGKTLALRRLIDGRRELTPQNMAVGPTMPFVSITAPSPCTLKQLAIELLRALGYPLERDVKENVAWNRVREQLRLRKVLIVHIDEMQHAVRFPDGAETQKVSDTLKNVMQQADWPVSFVLSGLPSLVEFAQRDVQLGRRCRFLSFTPLKFPNDAKGLHHIVRTVATKAADLEPVGLDGSEFLARLCRAAEGQFGRVVQICRTAAEDAIRAGAAQLTIADFASAYAATTGCPADTNIFLARDWEFVRPGVAPAENPSSDEPAEPKTSKKRKSA